MPSNSSLIQNKPRKAAIIEGKPSTDVMHHCKHPAVIDPLPDQNTHLLITTYIVKKSPTTYPKQNVQMHRA